MRMRSASQRGAGGAGRGIPLRPAAPARNAGALHCAHDLRIRLGRGQRQKHELRRRRANVINHCAVGGCTRSGYPAAQPVSTRKAKVVPVVRLSSKTVSHSDVIQRVIQQMKAFCRTVSPRSPASGCPIRLHECCARSQEATGIRRCQPSRTAQKNGTVSLPLGVAMALSTAGSTSLATKRTLPSIISRLAPPT